MGGCVPPDLPGAAGIFSGERGRVDSLVVVDVAAGVAAGAGGGSFGISTRVDWLPWGQA
jgi:hypothetical protein